MHDTIEPRRSAAVARAAGFTLTELMAVMAAMVILLAVIVPSVKNLLSARRVEAGIEALSAATASLRGYSGRQPPFGSAVFQGVAIVFAPSGEMRLTQHVLDADDAFNNPLVGKSPPKAGYRDMAGQAYVNLPPDIGVMGVTRGGSFATPEVEYLAPPFAVRFDKNGAMIVRKDSTSADGNVYYDGNYDDKFGVTSDRGSVAGGYEPEEYDPESTRFDTDNIYGADPSETDADHIGKVKFAFEQLESVVGVVFYSKKAFWAGPGGSDGLDSEYTQLDTGQSFAERDWLANNGVGVVFNRYTGAVIRP